MIDSIGKAFFGILKADPEFRGAVFKAVGMVASVDKRLRRIEAALGLPPFEELTEEAIEESYRNGVDRVSQQ